MLEKQRIAFIGSGQITEIIVDNLSREQVVPPAQLIVSDIDRTRLYALKARFAVTIAADNIAAAKQADLVLINVRPEAVGAILPDLQAAQLRPGQVLISLAAAVPLRHYACLGEGQPLVRALLNPPSRIGQGVAALAFAPSVTVQQRRLVVGLFAALGQVVEVEESDLNTITALSSPVATYLFFQSLIDAGVRCGLPRPIATQVAAQTIVGSMAIWQSNQESPSELIAEASTPGGISVESLYALERHAFKAAIMDAIAQGSARADVLGDGVSNKS